MNEKLINQKAAEYAHPLYAQMREALACPNEADLAEAFKEGAKFTSEYIRKDIMRLLTNIPHSEEYVDPDWYSGELDIILDKIDELLNE